MALIIEIERDLPEAAVSFKEVDELVGVHHQVGIALCLDHEAERGEKGREKGGKGV